MSSNTNSDSVPQASPNFSGQEPFSSLHVTALEEPPSPSPPYVSPTTPPPQASHFAPRYSTLEVGSAEKGYAKDSSTPVAPVEAPEEPRKRWSRKKFIIVIIIAVVVVLGAVLGGVLGSVLSKRSGGSTDTG
jgi:hypothetical protein